MNQVPQNTSKNNIILRSCHFHLSHPIAVIMIIFLLITTRVILHISCLITKPCGIYHGHFQNLWGLYTVFPSILLFIFLVTMTFFIFLRMYCNLSLLWPQNDTIWVLVMLCWSPTMKKQKLVFCGTAVFWGAPTCTWKESFQCLKHF